MFMHGGLLHLGGNMLFLWIFGNNVEDAMGHVKFIVFYVLAGLAALALQTVIGPNSDIPTVGASGAIAGVLGGYIVRFPGARVVTVIFIVFFFTILELPALLVLGIWFLQQALFGYFDLAQPAGSGGGVAYFAHIGGFVFGLLAIRVFARRRQRPFSRA
jgi:membrane associated rhomboid family serine protease